MVWYGVEGGGELTMGGGGLEWATTPPALRPGQGTHRPPWQPPQSQGGTHHTPLPQIPRRCQDDMNSSSHKEGLRITVRVSLETCVGRWLVKDAAMGETMCGHLAVGWRCSQDSSGSQEANRNPSTTT